MKPAVLVLACMVLAGASGCASTNPPGEGGASVAATPESATGRTEGQQTVASKASVAHPAKSEINDFNQKLMTAASGHPADDAGYQYRLGPGDVLTVNADQVDELNNVQVRINDNGTVTLPLLGDVKIAGLTTNQAEQLLAKHLGEYVYTPQVSLFVNAYRSQEVTVTGAVKNPGIFNINRPRTLLEMLSVAGGLADNASYTVSVQTEQTNPKSGRLKHALLIVDLRKLVKDPDAQALVLHGGDSVFVPEAGVFFVEGAVKNPGAYPIHGDMNVLKAISMAGGLSWDAIDDNVRVIRHNEQGVKSKVLKVDFAAIRDENKPDVALKDGDTVVVDTNETKKIAWGAWREIRSVLAIGWIFRPYP